MKTDFPKVRCAECGKEMSAINNRHLSSHGMTADEYRAKYPGHQLLSEAAQKKLSDRSVAANATRKGKARSEAERDAIREGIARGSSRKGQKRGPMSEEAKRKLSETHKEAFRTGKREHPRRGVSLSQETRDKIAASLTGRKVGSEAAMKAIETKKARGHDLAFFRGRAHSEETKRKIGDMSRNHFTSIRPVLREPMVERIRESNLVLLNGIDAPVFELRCVACDHEFTRTPQMFQPSKWSPEVCDQCYPASATSVPENEVAEYLGSLLPNSRMIRSDMQRIAPLEIDIVLPDSGIAVEFCGLYWHSEIAGKSRFYHQHKWRACSEEGLRLVTIFEDEWAEKRPLVEMMLRNLAGQNQERINARDCEIAVLTSDEANDFINANHIQGRGRSKVKYGLVHDGKIVSVMTFMDQEISRKMEGWEINRFCSLAGYNVRGAASKLFTAFVRDHNPPMVTSYADLRWGNGGVYEAIGFERIGATLPNYWYFKPNSLRRFHRYGLRKTASDPAGMTEWQARQAEGWNRIWDCGHMKYVWKR